MTVPTRIRASRQHPEPEGTFRVCRTSRFGNDYRIRKLKSGNWQVFNPKTNYISISMGSENIAHEHAVRMFQFQIDALLAIDPAYYDILLKYKHISCFCPLDLPCHCDPIIKLLERRELELTK